MCFNLNFIDKYLYLYLLFFLTLSVRSYGQTFEMDYKNAVDYRFKKEYASSDSMFKIVLKKYKKNLPEELCYHYGVVLYHLKKEDQSKQFLNKYLSFKQNNYIYQDSTKHYLTMMNGVILIPESPKGVAEVDSCDLCHGEGQVLQDCHKCSASGRFLCYQCKGTGMLSLSTEIGNPKFHKCHICEGVGTLQCNLCKGQKRVVDKCVKCKGTGKILIYK